MGNTPILSGLPTDVQAAVSPVGNAADSGVARMPTPQVPMAPQGQQDVGAAPDINAPQYAPGSLADKIASAYLQHITNFTPKDVSQPPSAPSQPSTMQKVGNALNTAAAGLGDAAAAQGGDPHSGWLGGVARVLNARTARKTAEENTKFDQQERLKNDQINIAVANSNLRQHALAIQKQEQDIRNEAAASGETFMSHLRDNYQVTDKINQDQLQQMVTNDPKFLQTHTARITGYEPVLNADGSAKVIDGKPVESPLWSVANLAPGDMNQQLTVSDTLSKKWAAAGLATVPPGTMMPATVANKMDVQADRYGTTLSILNHDKVQPLPNDVKDQMVSALQDPDVQHAVAMEPGSPLTGLYAAASNMKDHIDAAKQQLQAAQQKGDQNAVQQLTQDIQSHQQIAANLDKVINQGFTDGERSAYAKQLEADRKQSEIEKQNAAKDAETARHNKADEGLKATELSQKKTQTVISNLTGNDYLQTLPQQQQSIVQAVGEGRQALPANRKEALALLEQVHQAYPDFDETKVKTWQKANNEYRGSGKTAVQIVPAYNTALEHMQDLYSNTTPDGIFNPLSKAYQDRDVALGYVAREVGKAVSAGAMTQKESEDLLSTLKGGLTPTLKRERITKTAQLLHDKIDEYQTKFQESAPSSAVKVPVLISPKAAQSYDFVTSGGQPQQQNGGQVQQAAPSIPAGARAARDAKGNVVGYVMNGKYVGLGAQ